MENVIGRSAPKGAIGRTGPELSLAGVAGVAAAPDTPATDRGGLRPSVLSLTIRDKSALVTAYMRFIDGGGLFIPTTRAARLGDEVYAMVTLVDDGTRMPIPGKVCWINPPGVPGRPQGIGVQFARSDAGEQARNTIENLIGAGHKPERFTQTI